MALGLCARVQGASTQEALAILARSLPACVPVTTGNDRIEYVEIYINTKALVAESDVADGPEAA